MASGSPIRVLLVDDEDMFVTALVALLACDSRVEVVATAARGAEAIAAALAHTPDVVLMDLGLPDMDGLEAARRVRANRPETQVIVVSGWDAEDFAPAARAAGAAAFVSKGAIDAAIAETIAEVATGRDAQAFGG